MSTLDPHISYFLKNSCKRAWSNVQRRGLCDREGLLLTMQERLGQLIRAHLESRDESGSIRHVAQELINLGALVVEFAFVLALEVES